MGAQVLQDQAPWRAGEPTAEILDVVAVPAADVDQQRPIIPFALKMEALEKQLDHRVDVKPFRPPLAPPFQHGEDIGQLPGMLHQVREQWQIRVVGVPEIAGRGVDVLVPRPGEIRG